VIIRDVVGIRVGGGGDGEQMVSMPISVMLCEVEYDVLDQSRDEKWGEHSSTLYLSLTSRSEGRQINQPNNNRHTTHNPQDLYTMQPTVAYAAPSQWRSPRRPCTAGLHITQPNPHRRRKP
jgi:hypothetical protein